MGCCKSKNADASSEEFVPRRVVSIKHFEADDDIVEHLSFAQFEEFLFLSKPDKHGWVKARRASNDEEGKVPYGLFKRLKGTDEFPAKLDTDDDPDTNMAVVRGLSEDGSVIPTEDGSLDASSKRVSSLDASAKQKSTQGASANWRGKVGDDESVSSGSGSGSGSASYSCSSGSASSSSS